ncbi:MAG TPA: HAD family hydrolase [Candidatus Competibacteraceae bacterium]|nr:HAD family hydrolase [Candidatus Competibacteraceae bacterium]
MAKVRLGERQLDIDLVVFDKDGTLIDFHYLWGRKALRYVDAILTDLGADSLRLRDDLLRSLGFDLDSARTRADSPLAVASMPKLNTVTAVVLYQHGVGWHEAERLAGECFRSVLAALPTHDMVRPIGDVAGLCRALREAGVRIALATSDDRAATRATLPILGIEDCVDLLVCGDDPIPNKPSPEGLYHLGRVLAVEPRRMIMVGDSVCDMDTGRNAGVAARVAVLSGTGEAETLRRHADVVLADVHGIRPL